MAIKRRPVEPIWTVIIFYAIDSIFTVIFVAPMQAPYMKRITYGYDEPKLIRNAAIAYVLANAAAFLIPYFWEGRFFTYTSYFALFIGWVTSNIAVSLFIYGRWGKYRMRDYMMSVIPWTGAEQVLDVGTGQGLLMNAAAKKLTTGKAVGIEIWDASVSDNSREKALHNAELEGVADKVEVINMDARHLTFADNTFDVVLSLFSIRYIGNAAEREKACYEIARVLKPGGTALIADHFPVGSYAVALAKAGLKVESSRHYIWTSFSLTWMAVATK